LSTLDGRKSRRQALVVLLGQGLFGSVVAAACAVAWGSRAGGSALAGAGIGIAATSLMAFAMLRHGASAGALRVAVSFLTGWLVKVGLTVALLVVAFRSPQVEPVPMLAAYGATFLGYWFGATRLAGSG
jgi:ATP synthase protein I